MALFVTFWLLSHLPTALSQTATILPATPSSDFPSCAFGCSNLNAAASYCLQTNAGASQDTVAKCFCKRQEVSPLYRTSAGVCDAYCASDDDLGTLQTWFKSFCAKAGVTSGGTVTTLITSTRSQSATAAARPGSGSNSQSGGWFANHWRWVVMVLVLIVALTALGFICRYLKRRHARKVAERRAAASGIPRNNGTPDIGHGREMWGPHQHMAHTGGFEYTTEQHRQMRDASAPGPDELVGGSLEKSKSTKSETKRSLRKKSRHGSQRKGDTEATRAEGDENARKAAADVRRPRSQKRKEAGDGELKGMSLGNDQSKDKQRADTDWRYDKEAMI